MMARMHVWGIVRPADHQKLEHLQSDKDSESSNSSRRSVDRVESDWTSLVSSMPSLVKEEGEENGDKEAGQQEPDPSAHSIGSIRALNSSHFCACHNEMLVELLSAAASATLK